MIRHGKGSKVALLCLLIVLVAASWLGGFAAFERRILDLQTHLGERQASGEIVIVEIDPKSIDALKQWPWPRRLHAQALNALSERDPRLIAFDVDFSSRQSPEDDAALSRALQSTKATTVLAAFEQASAVEGRSIAALPLPALRSKAFIGNANVRPDPDGAVRTYPVAAEIAGQLRPSLATLTAEANVQRASEILIDYSIDPASIPRLSFIDLLRGDIATLSRGARSAGPCACFAVPSSSPSSALVLALAKDRQNLVSQRNSAVRSGTTGCHACISSPMGKNTTTRVPHTRR